MKIIFWLSFILLLYTYFGYPLILIILAKIRLKQVIKADITPTVTLIIPAFNEEKVIKGKIENSLEIGYPKDKLQIIIATEGCTDHTNDIVRGYKDQGIVLMDFVEQKGKSSLYFRTVPHAKGDIIIFSDADAILHKEAVRNIVKNFNDERIGCVEGTLKDSVKKDIQAEGIFRRYELFVKRLETGLFSSLGVTGALFAIRKNLYNPINESRGDDFEISARILINGSGVISDFESVVYHPFASNLNEFSRLIRIISFYLPSMIILLSEAMKKKKFFVVIQIVSRKLLRWAALFIMTALFVSNLFMNKEGFYKLFLISQLIFYLLAICGYVLEKMQIKTMTIFKIPFYFCLINLAALIGIFGYLFGKKEIHWEKTGR